MLLDLFTPISTVVAGAVEGGAGPVDPSATIVLWLAAILVAAALAGHAAVRLGQPAVLGELIVGLVLGNLALVGVSAFEPLKTDPFLDMFARIGVLLLLFEVGLESTVRQMARVGLSALLVACFGVIAPFALGWGVGAWLLPEHSGYVHAFLGATLAATSVGITARVLQDLNRSQSPEARVILGAAVIDDVLGLVILAAVTSAIAAADRGGEASYGELAGTLGKALAFLGGGLAIGAFASPRIFATGSRLKARGVLLAIGLSFCFFFSWLANAVGLASIIGAFAAGLVLEESHLRPFTGRGERGLHDLIQPISSVLVPVFFVVMGMRTQINAFARADVLGVAVALTAAAIIGKQACSLGVIGKGIDRLTVGVGMIPRGEVGMIFANVGLQLTVRGERVIDQGTFSAVVVMVIVTTMVTPPALKWSLSRLPHKPRGHAI
jgi:Kef-type K+ transport system membrane component KefB